MKQQIEDTQQEASDMDKMKEMAKEVLGLSGTTKVKLFVLLFIIDRIGHVLSLI